MKLDRTLRLVWHAWLILAMAVAPMTQSVAAGISLAADQEAVYESAPLVMHAHSSANCHDVAPSDPSAPAPHSKPGSCIYHCLSGAIVFSTSWISFESRPRQVLFTYQVAPLPDGFVENALRPPIV
jgi:hypothetical protein